MSLERAVELIGSLLIPQTYTELQTAEEVLKEQGIHIKDDFVMTDERKQVLTNVRNQFTNMVAPTVILTGWFGSGKTALLSQIIRDLAEGKLLYGGRDIDTICLELNVQNTLSLFLTQIFDSIASLTSSDWVVNQYQKAWEFVDLPQVTPGDTRDLVKTLVQMQTIQMAQVVHFLDELFDNYKRSTKGKRLLALIIDELENLTRKATLEGEDKFVELLRLLIDRAVRQYKDHLAVIRDPRVIVVFSITSRRELAATGWFYQDTLDRMTAVEQDVNLSLQTAEYLMKRMLHMYFATVVDAVSRESVDGRLHDWSRRLSSAPDVDDIYYTYPIMPEVHKFFVSRLLVTSPPEGQVRRFRAYQVGMHTLLNAWPGEGAIDLPFMIELHEQLRDKLEEFPGGVFVDNLIGDEQVNSFVDRRFADLGSGPKEQLGTVTYLAITRGTTPVVPITRKDLEEWLPEGKIPTEEAFLGLLKSVRGMGVEYWSVAGDTIYVDVESVVAQLSAHVEPVSVEQRAEELTRETQAERAQESLLELFGDTLDSEVHITAYCDDLGILHVTDSSGRGQLIGTYFLAFDVDEKDIRRRVEERIALCPGIVYREADTETENGFPFEISVVLPAPLRSRGDYYATKIRERFEQWWRDSFFPLISALVRLEQCSYYQAFQEALKTILLLGKRSDDERDRFKDFDRSLRQITMAFDLTPTDTEHWISAKLNLASFHAIDPTHRLIKVLSWRGQEEESLLYDSSDEVQPQLHEEFSVNLPTPEEWKRELAKEWEEEDFVSDGRLVPWSKWLEGRRHLYTKVNDRLREQALSFYDVGKLVFGNTRIDALPKARTALHLFVKLGKISPLNWTLTDDRHGYKDMLVRSGALRKKELIEQTRTQLELKLRDLVLAFHLASASAQTQWLDDIRQVLRMKTALGDDTPIPVLQEWHQKLNAMITEKPSKHFIESDLIQTMPSHLTKVAEYLHKLGRLLQLDSALSDVVSQRVPALGKALAVDVAFESLFKRIEELYTNWGKEVPFQWKKDRFLMTLYDRYTTTLGHIQNWEQQKATECDSRLRDAVSLLAEDGIEEALDSIWASLQESADEIIDPQWRSSYDEEDRSRLEHSLEDSLERARREVVELVKELESQLDVLDELQRSALLTRYAQEIKDYRWSLRQNLGSLSRMEERLLEEPFAYILRDVRARLNQLNQLKTEMVQTQTSMVEAWLQDYPELEPLRERILHNFDRATMGLNKLCDEMVQAGINPVQRLLAGELDDLLALFAAAQLLNALEKGELEWE